MNKCNTFEDLQQLGTEKIHERTHIARDKVELILTKSYAELDKVKFMGFISILEREYGLDLNGIREEYKAFRAEYDKEIVPAKSVILQAPSSSRTKWFISSVSVIALLVGAGYLFQNSVSKAPQEELMQLGGLAVEVVHDAVEQNLTQELNATAQAESNLSVETENNASLTEPQTPLAPSLATGSTVVITPVYKVWVGMIDLENGEKTQKITKDPITLDASKKLLIVFGHGRLDIQSGGTTQSLQEKNTVWFVLENGVLKQITKSEFVERNGGKNW